MNSLKNPGAQSRPHFYFEGVDGLRFISFLLIFLHHTPTLPYFPFTLFKNIGWIGVDIFFCLSGFLLTALFKKEFNQTSGIDVKAYYIRRVLRIWPLYFLYVFSVVFIWHHIAEQEPSGRRVLGLISFTDNLFSAVEGFNPIPFTAHLWTISYEEQFYILLPVLILMMVRQKNITQLLLTIFFVSLVLRIVAIYLKANHLLVWVLPFTHCESILLGTYLGWIYPKYTGVQAYKLVLVLLVSVTSIYLFPSTDASGYHLILLYPIVAVVSAVAVVFAVSEHNYWLKKILTNSIVQFLGKISYGLYVFHILAINISYHFFSAYGVTLSMLVSLFITIILASVSYVGLERPLLRFKQRFEVVRTRERSD